ncbi:RHS repeat-associated core domain-containing protein [Pseudomonas putida]|uniref:RHS repeat-associated core domain-containing protein n=1 Tax=Pseudomonas putida TaxID=303 RepID=UPI00383B910D
MSIILRAYSPYGQYNVGASQSYMLGFNGERYDLSTQTYALGQGYRNYSPALMRFHTPDDLSPFGLGWVNGYAYCANDPLNYRDDTGHVRTSARFTQLKDFWMQQSSSPVQPQPKRSAAPRVLNNQAETKRATPLEKTAGAKRVRFDEIAMNTSYHPSESIKQGRTYQGRQALSIDELKQKIKRNQIMLDELLDESTLDFARSQGIEDTRYLAGVKKLNAWLDRAQLRLERLNAKFEAIRQG